jgi:hypothetical protein
MHNVPPSFLDLDVIQPEHPRIRGFDNSAQVDRVKITG